MLAYYAGIVCQHLSKEVSIGKMPAYYAGILCQHLRKEVSISKMPAYYAGIVCQHLRKEVFITKMLASCVLYLSVFLVLLNALSRAVLLCHSLVSLNTVNL